MVIQSIKSVFAIMMLIFTGFYFTGKKWFGKPGMDFLSKFTVEATLPFYMFYSIHRDIGTRKGLIELFSKLPVTFCLILFILLLAAYSRVRFPQCGIYRISCDTGIVGRRDHLCWGSLLYFEHGIILDDRYLAPPKGWEKRKGFGKSLFVRA